jgi:hypothetical protein
MEDMAGMDMEDMEDMDMEDMERSQNRNRSQFQNRRRSQYRRLRFRRTWRMRKWMTTWFRMHFHIPHRHRSPRRTAGFNEGSRGGPGGEEGRIGYATGNT